jgi:hypothetical protein
LEFKINLANYGAPPCMIQELFHIYSDDYLTWKLLGGDWNMAGL